jgi:hypothetical protein
LLDHWNAKSMKKMRQSRSKCKLNILETFQIFKTA